MWLGATSLQTLAPPSSSCAPPSAPGSPASSATSATWSACYDIKAAVLKAWDEMPESVILNSFEHLEQVHEGIVERKGGNRTTKGT
jgi:hypothetical protein